MMARAVWLWLAASALGIGWFLIALLGPSKVQKAAFLPGKTTHGHYQIELSCDACHTRAFGGTEALDEGCRSCHAAELQEAKDSHPTSKFTDPRNAARVAILDARSCVACHKEHQPEQTHSMGLTLPEDYCFKCHEDVGKERPTHQGLDFATCASGGCHNFHDNRALYEDFLLDHAREPVNKDDGRMPASTVRPVNSLSTPDLVSLADKLDVEQLSALKSTAHGRSPLNCSSCHESRDASAKVSIERCRSCHGEEAEAWEQSHHGMSYAAGNGLLRTGQARLPMKAGSNQKALDCNSCHPAHGNDPAYASFEACMHCHDDEHSNSYSGSKHFKTFEQAIARGALETGVSCATCHLPRVRGSGAGSVLHNPNATLRPNEKMVRPVCLNCHGLAFALDALADDDLVRRNFQGQPSRHVTSIEMAVTRDEQHH